MKLFKIKYNLILLLALFMGGSFVCIAQEDKRPKIDLKVSVDTLMIGDQETITVTVDKDVSQIVFFPELDTKMTDAVEVLDESDVDTVKVGNRREKLSKKYTFTSFDAGSYNLGNFPIMYVDKNIIDTLYTMDSIRFVVETIAIDTTKQKIFTVKPPVDMPLIFSEIDEIVYWSIFGILVIVLAIYLIRKFIKNRHMATEDGKPKLPPHIIAISELERIKNENLWQSGKTKQYYTEVTDVVRDYLSERYEVNAKEMTTDEILDVMNSLINTKGKDYNILRELLLLSDLVKFAKMQPTPEDNQMAFDNAYYFVEMTKQEVKNELEEPISEGGNE